MTSAEEGSRRYKNKSISSSSFSSSIIKKIRQSHLHDNDVMIYPDLPTFRQVYSQATREALERNEIVFLTTTYDSFQRVIDSLKQGRISVNKEVKHGTLIILDAVKGYQIDVSGVLNFAKKSSHACS